MAKTPNLARADSRAMGLRTILDEQKAVLRCQRFQRQDICRNAVQVYGDDGCRTRGDRGSARGHIEIPRVWIHVGQHWHAARLNDGRRRTGCGEGGHDDFPALGQPRGPQGQRQRVGAGVHANAVRNLQIPGERGLEAGHRRPKDIVSLPQDFLHGGHEGILVSTQPARRISLRQRQRRGDG